MKEEYSLDPQLCRWLLLSLDRLQGTEMVMTQQLGTTHRARSSAFRSLGDAFVSAFPSQGVQNQLGNGIEGERSRSFTAPGANSHHSTPTPSLAFRDTYAAIAADRCDDDGLLMLT